ncbi:MAG: hypothetical protein ACRDNJ_04560 [Solirubrobacteraceae bacterium]
MFDSKLNRIAALVGALVAVMAFAGLAWAASTTGASRHQSKHHAKHQSARSRHLLCLRYDSDDTPQCLRQGPRGYRGRRGYRGHRGARGPVGLTGVVGQVGPVGLQGNTGAQGIQGIQGIKGIQGPVGAFATGGVDAGLNLYEVAGSMIQTSENNGSPGVGTALPQSVALCRSSGPDREAYDGGAVITTTNSSGTVNPNDVVELEQSYPGLYAGPTEVDPLPLGSTPGAVSPQPANAYGATAVIDRLANGDHVTLQAYVICGP